MVLRKSFYIRWSAGRSPRVHEVNPGRDPSVTPQTRGSIDYPSISGILVNVGRPDIFHENRAESPLYGELYPNTKPV